MAEIGYFVTSFILVCHIVGSVFGGVLVQELLTDYPFGIFKLLSAMKAGVS
jgi:hypothetical protein